MITRFVTESFCKGGEIRVFQSCHRVCNECGNELFIRVIRFVIYNGMENNDLALIRMSLYR